MGIVGLPPSGLITYKMILLTQCAVCATDLGLTSGKKCGRCSTRYCGAECQKQHWESGGHDKLCKKIKKAGGAEQYHANKKYTESVTIAAEACAEDTKGQTCYICLQAVHSRTGEGLVRGCACGDRDGVASGTTGIAHVSCLAEEAKTLLVEALENNLDHKVKEARFLRWCTCSLCEQRYHGVVACALGWACWKTYVGRPETDTFRLGAMGMLGNGLSELEHYEDALSVQEVELSMLRRLGATEVSILITQSNLASTYQQLGREESALRMFQDVYSGDMKLKGEEHFHTLAAALNYASSLGKLDRFGEAKLLLRKTVPVARRVLGDSDKITLRLRSSYARALCQDDGATLDDLRETMTTFEEIEPTARRVFGGAYPFVVNMEHNLKHARAALAIREGDDDLDDALRDAVAALRVKK